MDSSIPDHRNAQGLTALRARYCRRARVLARNGGAGSFLEAIKETRASWSTRYPEYQITPGIADPMPPIPDSRQNAFFRIFWPGRILRDYEYFIRSENSGPELIRASFAHQDWLSIVNQLCVHFWNPVDFSRPYGMHRQPCARFVSASLLLDVRTMDAHAIDNLFEPLKLRLESLPYPPDPFDRFERTRREGERDSYRESLKQLVGEGAMDPFDQQAAEAGYDHAYGLFPQGPVPDPNESPYWWYLPLLPGISSTDLVQAASDVAEHSKYVFGERPVEERIRDLASDGLSHSKIAMALGISESLVSRTLKKTKPDPA